ncbi:MAG: hypothetical protein WC366_02675 [Bacilli bacterium]
MAGSFIKKAVRKIPLLNKIYYRMAHLESVQKFRAKVENKSAVPEEQLLSAPDIIIDWNSDVKKPLVGLVKDGAVHGYYEKYEKFLLANKIPYEFYDPSRSDFFEKAQKYDVIIWRVTDKVTGLYEAKQKIEFIEKNSKTLVFPSYKSLWCYEEKVRQCWFFANNEIPHIKSFVSNNYLESLDYIKRAEYPIISKESTSFSSLGVDKIKSYKRARKIVNDVFANGKKSTYSWMKQKDYVLFQEYVPNEGYDLRIVVIDDFFFGYYRYPKKHDYRASGSGIVVKKDIDIEALDFARKVYAKYDDSVMLAIDMIKDTRDNQFKVVETSIFIGCETSQQLKVDDVAGVYRYRAGKYVFEKGNFWLQEVTLKVFFERYIKKQLMGNQK